MNDLQLVLISVSISLFFFVVVGIFFIRFLTNIFNERHEELSNRYRELLRIVLLVKKTMMEALIRDTQLFDNLLEDWSDEVPATVPVDEEGEIDASEQTDPE